MKGNRVVVDLRRHDGDVVRIVSVVSQYIAGLGGATVDWLLRPDQALSPPDGNVLGIADATDGSWTESISRHLLDLQGTQSADAYWVLSYNKWLLGKIRSAFEHSGHTVTVLHFGEVFARVRSSRSSEGALLPSFPAGELSIAAAVDMAKRLLRAGQYTASTHALPQKDLRPALIRLDARATKRLGNYRSENLVRDIVARGKAEGWLAVFQKYPGQSGTEAIYLVSDPAVEAASALPSPPAVLPAQTVVPENAQVVQVSPSADFEKIHASQQIGAIPRTRELLFDAIESVVSHGSQPPLLLNDLLDVALTKAQELAVELKYVQEGNWPVTGRCILRLMCRSGVLIDPDGKVILDRIGRDSRRVAKLADDFRFVAELYLAEAIIRGARRFHYDDHTYYLGLVIYKQGPDAKLTPGELKGKADLLLTALEQQGRIAMSPDHIIRISQPANVSDFAVRG